MTMPNEPVRYEINETFDGPQSEISPEGPWILAKNYDALRAHAEAETKRADELEKKVFMYSACINTAGIDKLAAEVERLNYGLTMAQAASKANHERAEQAEAALAEAKRDKDDAYSQRNHVVAALARLFPSGIRATNIGGWNPEWHGCVYINLPSGQISYHYHDSQAHLFADLPPYKEEWDGHDKDAVHQRLAAIDAAKEPK